MSNDNHEIISQEEDTTLKELRKHLLPTRLEKVKEGMLESIEVSAALFEGSGIAYGTYYIVSWIPKLESRYAYIYVGVAGAANAGLELAKLKGKVSIKTYHVIDICRQASISAGFIAGLAQTLQVLQNKYPDLNTIIIGGAIFSVLTPMKAAAHLLHKRPFFQTNTGKVINISVKLVNEFCLGASIIGDALGVAMGYGAPVPPLAFYSTMAAGGVINLAASNYLKHRHKNAAHIYNITTLMIALFSWLLTLESDITTDILHSTDLKNYMFWTLFAIAASVTSVIGIKTYFTGREEERFLNESSSVIAQLSESDEEAPQQLKDEDISSLANEADSEDDALLFGLSPIAPPMSFWDKTKSEVVSWLPNWKGCCPKQSESNIMIINDDYDDEVQTEKFLSSRLK